MNPTGQMCDQPQGPWRTWPTTCRPNAHAGGRTATPSRREAEFNLMSTSTAEQRLYHVYHRDVEGLFPAKMLVEAACTWKSHASTVTKISSQKISSITEKTKTIDICPGTSTGCSFKAKKRSLPYHVSECIYVRLQPMFNKQNEAISELRNENRRLQHQLSSQSAGCSRGLNDLQIGGTSAAPDSSSSTVDSTTHHLLTSYESLRSDMDRISSSLSALDARQSMYLMNERLRANEDHSYLTAAISSVRMQLNWLMSRIQNQPRMLDRPVPVVTMQQERRISGMYIFSPSSSSSSMSSSSSSRAASPE
ncbi:MAG: hypothetical protein M1825_000390 [Sarcosagium campestre]|nr:MAG: hypothetical protein M1825_000390 [Sarcosagium campestre]